MKIPSFPEILQVKHRIPIQFLYKGDVEITEKIDGSFFGFGATSEGDVVMRSKGKELFFDSSEKMFREGINHIYKIQNTLRELYPGMFFYGEYLQSVHHNVLTYERIPKNHIMLFGATNSDGSYFSSNVLLSLHAESLELEAVPCLYYGPIEYQDQLNHWLDTPSILGNCKVEGIVIKNYTQEVIFGGTVYPVFAKLVNEDFKERHDRDWKASKDKVEEFYDSFKTEARWRKAVQHLRENGDIEFKPQDIGKLIKELQIDFVKEDREAVMQGLWNLLGDKIMRRVTSGFPEWYKETYCQGEDNG